MSTILPLVLQQHRRAHMSPTWFNMTC